MRDRTKPLTRRTLRNRLVEDLDLDIITAAVAVSACMDTLAHHLSLGGRAELRGLGSFDVVTRAARVRRNPSNGSPVACPPTRVVVFKPSSLILQRLQSPTEETHQ